MVYDIYFIDPYSNLFNGEMKHTNYKSTIIPVRILTRSVDISFLQVRKTLISVRRLSYYLNIDKSQHPTQTLISTETSWSLYIRTVLLKSSKMPRLFHTVEFVKRILVISV